MEFERVSRHHFEFTITLCAGDYVAFFDVIRIQVEIVLAFRAKHHDFLAFNIVRRGAVLTCLYLRSVHPRVKCVAARIFPKPKGVLTMKRKSIFLLAAFAIFVGTVCDAAAAQAAKKARPKNPVVTETMNSVSATRIKATIEKLASFHNRNTLSAGDLASGKNITAARDWIKAEFERYAKDCNGCLEVKLDTFIEPAKDRIPQPTEISNVYAVMRGSDPKAANRIYVVTGHYDSRNSDTLNIIDAAPGANDDASGTAVSLECARVLSKKKFPATIIFMAVAGEEQGLNGARHFAKMAKSEGWNIEAVLNNDIVGGNRSKEQEPAVVRVFSEGIPLAATEKELRLIRSIGAENDSPSRQLARYIRDTWKKNPIGSSGFGPKMIFRPDRYLRGGDHTAFNEQGFAAVRFTEYREDYNRQHQNVRTENGIEYGDLPKFVDFEYVANVTRLNAAVLASLAAAPAPPANVKLLTKRLENDSQLAWEPSPDGRAVTYEVLWRMTTAAEWENVENASKATQLTVNRSKDNVIFAVRAVDRSGNRSLAVLPMPER